MVVEQIPNLVMAFSEPGRSEPTKMDGHVIAKSFTTIFTFKDGEKTWGADFNVTISDLGTPKLTGVSISGSRAPHPKPLTKTYTKDLVLKKITISMNHQKIMIRSPFLL